MRAPLRTQQNRRKFSAKPPQSKSRITRQDNWRTTNPGFVKPYPPQSAWQGVRHARQTWLNSSHAPRSAPARRRGEHWRAWNLRLAPLGAQRAAGSNKPKLPGPASSAPRCQSRMSRARELQSSQKDEKSLQLTLPFPRFVLLLPPPPPTAPHPDYDIASPLLRGWIKIFVIMDVRYSWLCLDSVMVLHRNLNLSRWTNEYFWMVDGWYSAV